jgi:sulfate adenylyltransferase subunit 2
MIRFRDEYAREIGADLIVHRNEQAIADGASSFRFPIGRSLISGSTSMRSESRSFPSTSRRTVN